MLCPCLSNSTFCFRRLCISCTLELHIFKAIFTLSGFGSGRSWLEDIEVGDEFRLDDMSCLLTYFKVSRQNLLKFSKTTLQFSSVYPSASTDDAAIICLFFLFFFFLSFTFFSLAISLSLSLSFSLSLFLCSHLYCFSLSIPLFSLSL